MEKPSEELATVTSAANDEEKSSGSGNRRRRLLRRCILWCVPLIIVTIIIFVILMFTIFRSRDPIFRINNVSVVKIELINGTNTPKPGTNGTINFDVSVKNRNFISFKYPLTRATIYYGGAVIGEAIMPPGKQVARRTMRANMTMEVIMDQMLSVPGLDSDIKSGLFTASASTKMGARVKFLFIKKHVRVKMNCTATVNITSMDVLHQKCKKKFKLF